MRILIAGSTGLLGKCIAERLSSQGHALTFVGRDAAKMTQQANGVKGMGGDAKGFTWDDLRLAPHSVLENVGTCIHHSGEPIGVRWTTRRMDEIVRSRVTATSDLVNALAATADLSRGSAAPRRLLNASAVGVYGLQHNMSAPLDESADVGLGKERREVEDDFGSLVCREWETAARAAAESGTEVLCLRFGVVLDKNGGALPNLALPFKLFVGGVIGSGEQPFPYITLADAGRAVQFLVDNPKVKGVNGAVNIVAGTVKQKDLAAALAQELGRPSLIWTPGFLMRVAYGQMAEELILAGQNVVPKVLLNAGFEFDSPQIRDALHAALH